MQNDIDFFSRYDDNKEIIGGCTHKSARLAVWRGDIYRLNRPPAVQFLQGQLLFQVQYTKDKSKMEKGHEAFVTFKKVSGEYILVLEKKKTELAYDIKITLHGRFFNCFESSFLGCKKL